MHNGDILSAHVIHDDLADLGVEAPVPQKQQVAALERRLHAAGQHDDYGRGRVCGDREAFPEHEGCA